MDNTPRIIRTLGFARAYDADEILGSAALGLDAVGPDLEDLTPRKLKDQARSIFRDVAKELAAQGVVVMARTNDLDTGVDEDLDAIMCPELHCINIPKAHSADHIAAFCELIAKAETKHGLPTGHTLVRPVVETAAGVRGAYEIAAASERVTYMGGVAGGFWGDLGATIGCITGPDGDESHYIRSKVIVDVRAAGRKFPIGGGGITNTDLDSVRTFALKNKRLGYTGQYTSLGYYSKDQKAARALIGAINDVYTPTPEEVEEWTAVLPALEAAEAEGTIVCEINGKNYDTAGLERVRDLLELAHRVSR